MKVKQKELGRLAESGVYETGYLCCSGEGELRHAGSWTTKRTKSERALSHESFRAMKRCAMSSRQAQLRGQDASSTT